MSSWINFSASSKFDNNEHVQDGQFLWHNGKKKPFF